MYSDFVFDADVQPEDVAEGKIFYNNAGRQVGALTGLPKVRGIPWADGDDDRISYYSYRDITILFQQDTVTGWHHEYSSYMDGSFMEIPGIKILKSMVVNGRRFEYPVAMNYEAAYVTVRKDRMTEGSDAVLMIALITEKGICYRMFEPNVMFSIEYYT